MELLIILAFAVTIGLIWYSHKSHQEDLQVDARICSVTGLNRGTHAEQALILDLLDMGIPAKSIFHDLYLKQGDDKYAQIDIIVPTKVGVLVFEVKDYAGWIYGKGNQTRWTQVLSYGRKKYTFYNPVKQNERHIEILRKKLGERVPFFSIVVFYGNSELKDISFIPQGTFVTKGYRVQDIVHGILNFNLAAQYKNKQNVMKVLNNAVKTGEMPGIAEEHIGNVNDMMGKDRVFD